MWDNLQPELRMLQFAGVVAEKFLLYPILFLYIYVF